MTWRHLFLCLAFPFLVACSTYHPMQDSIGFTEVPMGADGYQVTYAGDSDMTIAEARQFALLRAAELAALRDMPYFQITDEHVYLSYGVHSWPGTDSRIVETVPTRRGGARTVVYHDYSPGYADPYSIPEISLQIRLIAQPTDTSIPADYLIREAIANKIKLSPGVVEHLAALPETQTPVTLPAAPSPTTKPSPR